MSRTTSRTATRPMLHHPALAAIAALIPAAALAAAPHGATAQAAQPDIALITQATQGLALREIGPALMGGRIADIEFDPVDPDIMYAATCERRRSVWALLAGGPRSGIRTRRPRLLPLDRPRRELGAAQFVVHPGFRRQFRSTRTTRPCRS